MRVAGALTIVAGLMVSAIFMLLPATVSVFGVSGSCGLPIISILNSDTDDVAELCEAASWPRVMVGVATGGIATVGGVLMIALAPRRRQPAPQQYYWGQ